VAVRFLFVTVQGFESAFYGRVGAHLRADGHEVEHLTASRRAAARLRETGERARALQDVETALAPDEAARLETTYGPLLDLARTDPAARALAPAEGGRRAARIVRAVERALDDAQPDVLVPEVGRETIRLAAHAVARERGIPTLFLLYTIFPQPLRLSVDTLRGPIVPPETVRPLDPEERAAVAAFREAFVARDRPIRAHRSFAVTRVRLARLADELDRAVRGDSGNEYLHPAARLRGRLAAPLRALAARRLYTAPRPGRPYVYFPLHDVEDYKIAYLLPELADQAAVVERLAASLPPGYDLVLKEHPQSIGRNPLALLRRLAAPVNARLVPPRTSSHALIRDAAAVAVISSTTGLEALLHRKPVLTLGAPYYAGFGVTVDRDGLDGLEDALAETLAFEPDPERIDAFLHAAWRSCYDGAPVLVDDSDANAELLARSLDAAARTVDRVAPWTTTER
jgi:hypothetical protein